MWSLSPMRPGARALRTWRAWTPSPRDNWIGQPTSGTVKQNMFSSGACTIIQTAIASFVDSLPVYNTAGRKRYSHQKRKRKNIASLAERTTKMRSMARALELARCAHHPGSGVRMPYLRAGREGPSTCAESTFALVQYFHWRREFEWLGAQGKRIPEDRGGGFRAHAVGRRRVGTAVRSRWLSH